MPELVYFSNPTFSSPRYRLTNETAAGFSSRLFALDEVTAIADHLATPMFPASVDGESVLGICSYDNLCKPGGAIVWEFMALGCTVQGGVPCFENISAGGSTNKTGRTVLANVKGAGEAPPNDTEPPHYPLGVTSFFEFDSIRVREAEPAGAANLTEQKEVAGAGITGIVKPAPNEELVADSPNPSGVTGARPRTGGAQKAKEAGALINGVMEATEKMFAEAPDPSPSPRLAEPSPSPTRARPSPAAEGAEEKVKTAAKAAAPAVNARDNAVNVARTCSLVIALAHQPNTSTAPELFASPFGMGGGRPFVRRLLRHHAGDRALRGR
jgi:hypothetical protein